MDRAKFVFYNVNAQTTFIYKYLNVLIIQIADKYSCEDN